MKRATIKDVARKADTKVKVEIAPVELVLRESTGKVRDRERASRPKSRS